MTPASFLKCESFVELVLNFYFPLKNRLPSENVKGFEVQYLNLTRFFANGVSAQSYFSIM